MKKFLIEIKWYLGDINLFDIKDCPTEELFSTEEMIAHLRTDSTRKDFRRAGTLNKITPGINNKS